MAIARAIYKCFRKVVALPFILVIRFYQLAISPMLGTRCRFYPSCSQYALEAIKSRGILIGLWLMSKRLVKCHPGSEGGFDPVPEKRLHKASSGNKNKVEKATDITCVQESREKV